MRTPWTPSRDTAADVDEHPDHRRLRRERLELRAVVLVAVVGLLFLTRNPGVLDGPPGRPLPGPFAVLALVLGTYLVAGAVARVRYADPPGAEAERADALRSLARLPAGLVVAGLLYWYLGEDLQAALVWLAIFGPVMAVALVVRVVRTSRTARAPSGDGGTDRV